MPRNGSGVYSVYTPGNPVVAGTTIDPTAFNNTTNDLATALTNSIATNGESTVTANLPMSGFKHTGAAAATASGQYQTYGQAGNFTNIVAAGTLTGVTGLTMAGAVSGITTLSMSGALTGPTTVTDSAGNELGFKGLPTGSVTTGAFVAADRGKVILASAGVTVPNSVMSAGDVVTIFNNSAGAVTITATITTLLLAGTTSTGNRTLAFRGICTIFFLSSTVAIISGAGLT